MRAVELQPGEHLLVAAQPAHELLLEVLLRARDVRRRVGVAVTAAGFGRAEAAVEHAHGDGLRGDGVVDRGEELRVQVRAVVDAAEVALEVLLRHAAVPVLAAGVGAVQVRVEHDDGEGDNEHGVRVHEGADGRALVVRPVAQAERGEDAVHLLRLAGQLEAAAREEMAQRGLEGHAHEADGPHVAQADEVVVLLVRLGGAALAEVVPDVLLRQLVGVEPQERRDVPRRVADEVHRDEVPDGLLQARVPVDLQRLRELLAVLLLRGLPHHHAARAPRRRAAAARPAPIKLVAPAAIPRHGHRLPGGARLREPAQRAAPVAPAGLCRR
mmetsp:Transcript_16401/g.50182  ORF Transcript_16401/g.50182 Transcript_16401/m.50182 type:complete len:327 (-) Transcript_16401:3593-4573(-)